MRVHADGSLTAFPLGADGALEKRRHGIVTRARGVLYLENWALRIEDARVLWELPELAPAHGLLPVGDGRALCSTARNELVCLRDPGADPAGAEARKPEGAARAARPTLPGSGTGVVLADGTRIAGSVVRRPDGGVDLAPERGAARTFAREDLALIEADAAVERVGPELAVYRAAFAALSLEHREALAPVFENCLQSNLVDEARRIAGELRDFGAEPERLAALDRRLSGRVQASDKNAAAAREDSASSRSACASAGPSASPTRRAGAASTPCCSAPARSSTMRSASIRERARRPRSCARSSPPASPGTACPGRRSAGPSWRRRCCRSTGSSWRRTIRPGSTSTARPGTRTRCSCAAPTWSSPRASPTRA